MFSYVEENAIDALWRPKLEEDEQGLPLAARHRNLEPASAEFLYRLIVSLGARRTLEIGGSSGISTIAMAAAARQIDGHLTSIEIEPERQAESRATIKRLRLDRFVDYICSDAAAVLPSVSEVDLAFIDCEKSDYIRFFDMLRIVPGGFVVADNMLSHSLTDYMTHVRSRPGTESITLPIGKGLELTRIVR
jgi:caffeoyl-CoA O-methyltransferase